jgi:6-phosphogluconate dehydrogenase
MKLGFIGLGRMGFHMVERLLNHKLKVIAYNRSPDKVKKIAKKGAVPAYSVEELVEKLPGKKIVWLMLPAGKATDSMMKKVISLLNKGDIIVDGANDFYKNAEKHDKWCKKEGINFFDCGVSGGIWGLKNGYTLMVGGPKTQFKFIEPACKALSAKGAYGHFGNVGAGHFVKSVHNIIEYVYLQGIAEGVELLKGFKQPIDIAKATSVWRPASVVNSWLMDLANVALKRPDFKKIGPDIGSVTINELRNTKKAVKGYAPAFDVAVKIRLSKGKKFILGKRTIAAIRNEFGGHAVKKRK